MEATHHTSNLTCIYVLHFQIKENEANKTFNFIQKDTSVFSCKCRVVQKYESFFGKFALYVEMNT